MDLKNPKSEFAAIWKIGQAMWKKDYAGVYSAVVGFTWSEPYATLVKILTGSFVIFS